MTHRMPAAFLGHGNPMNALERNRWRDWLAVALLEFLIMYSWAGIMYALAMVNVATAILILMRKDRLPLLIRRAS